MHLGDVPGEPPRLQSDRYRRACNVLSIDLGTGGPKAAVLSAEGALLGHAFRPVGLTLLPDDGAEQDPEEWWTATVAAAREALATSGVPPDGVLGIGCTGQWSTTVAVGGDGRAVGPAISWMDARGSRAVRRQVGGHPSVLGYQARKAARWIRLTGGAPSLSGKDPVGHMHFLMAERPEVAAATRVYLEAVDYLNLRLTARACASYDSVAMYWVTDNRRIDRVRYDPALIAMAGLNPETLPELVPTGSVVGGLTTRAAEELGLVPGTPVVTASGDLHSAAVGAGAVADFAAHLYVGTSGWISCHVPFKKTDPLRNVASLPSALPGRYLVADEHETAGACLTFLRDLLYADDVLATPPPPEDALERLGALAATAPPGAHDVLFAPWLNGERTPVDDHTVRGGFHNLSLATTRADMVRAVFEGVALNARWLLDAVEHFVGRPFPSLAFVGGGARSELWAQIHADVTGRTVYRMADPILANVRGAGLLALRALGQVRAEDIPGMVRADSVHQPDPGTAAGYRAQTEELVALYKATKGIHRRRARR